jgi:predicted nucleic acid-binding protein
MAEIVNLRQARKRKARANKERAAEENRILHGRSKSEKARDAEVARKSRNFLEGHRRERPAGDGDA